MTGRALPRPRRHRWQPLRSGLLNLFRFGNEEFRYEDGHLLLRGNNGTGKSRILALQLPFLLDGDVSPYRLEPDGDPAKRVEWNLLLGKHSDRLGYTWIELGRLDGDDDAAAGDGLPERTERGPGQDDAGDPSREHYLTLGCGLRAVEGRGLVGKWFFVTTRRVGLDLALVGSAREPLSRPRLEEAIGDEGIVFTTAAPYRREVDRRLFGLGEARYEALVRLLIQLRQPQLARKLDEELLSRALSDALPPLSDAILADVAEAFGSLESERRAVDDLRAAGRGADTFLQDYRRYARVLTRRRAEVLRSRHSDYERSLRRQREAEALLEDAGRRLAALEERRRRLESDREELDARVRTLEASPEMRDKQALDRARIQAERTETDLARARQRSERARRDSEAGRERLELARTAATQRASAASAQVEETRTAADAAALADRGAADWATLRDATTSAPPSAEDVRQALRNLERHRAQVHAGVGLLRQAEHEIASRESALVDAREGQVRAAADVDGSLEAQRTADRERVEAVDDLLGAYSAWRAGLVVLAPAASDAVAEELAEWSVEMDGPSPVASAVVRAADKAREITSRHRATVENRVADVRAALEELRQRESELERVRDLPPPAPPTRDAEARATRTSGAPLWRLIDFRTDADPGARAGAEAALEAAGLLDAWVTPAGDLLDATEHDVVLTLGSGPTAGADDATSLRALLRPESDAPGGVPAEVVDAILGRIGWGSGHGDTWVAPDGRFCVGPLAGAWAKPAEQYVGTSARQAERRRRLAGIALEIEEAERRLDELRRELEDARRQAEELRAEVARAPTDDAVREAAARVASLVREVQRARERLADAERLVRERRARRDESVAERDRAAEDLGLAHRLDELESLAAALDATGRRLAALDPVLELHRTAAREVIQRDEEAGRQDASRDQAIREEREAESAHTRARTEWETLRSTLGDTVERLLQRLDEARQERTARVESLEEVGRENVALRVEQARAEERIEAEAQALGVHEIARAEAIDELRDVARHRLPEIGATEVDVGRADEWSPTRAVEVARALEAALSDVESGQKTWDSLQSRVHERFRVLTDTLLPHGYEPSLTTPGGVVVVRVSFQGEDRDVDEFRTALLEETSTRDRILAAREREILENHLLGEISLHLHDRLRAAEELVAEINREIESRPMSTGMNLRFDWRPREKEIDHLKEARRLLLTDHRVRSPAENQAVTRFLDDLIRREREADDTGTWNDHLTRAFDYRAWHRFAIEQRQPGQPWRRLTRRTHGTGSGGEKAIALTVPQFAAAAAHYRSALPEAPRLILLDEAFVGVDADMRAKCMGLLAAFDLDFVMTSEREWGCYPTLPGLAIVQLTSHPGIDAIATSRWVWNGRERRPDDAPRPGLPGPPEEAEAAPDDGGQGDLFGGSDGEAAGDGGVSDDDRGDDRPDASSGSPDPP